MKVALWVLLLGDAASTQTESGFDAVIVGAYALSILCIALGAYFAVTATKTKQTVLKKHSANMAILNDWDRAVRYAYSGIESEILIALDLLWALDDPRMYLEIKPLVDLLVNHNNKNISLRAQKILERQLASLSTFPPTG